MLRHTDERIRVLWRPIASAAEKRKTKIRQLRGETINRSFSGRLPDRPETRRSHDIGPRETHQENQNTGNSSNPGFLIVVFRTADPLCTSDGSQPDRHAGPRRPEHLQNYLHGRRKSGWAANGFCGRLEIAVLLRGR